MPPTSTFPHVGALAAAMLLAACESAHMPVQPSQHEGLDRNSYGMRMPMRDPSGKPGIPSCNPQARNAGANEFARQLTAITVSPLSGLAKVDRSILSEDLQSSFRMPGDVNGSTVAILDRGPAGIVFWHIADLVVLEELDAAAGRFCQRDGHRAVYVGSARHCKPFQMPVKINGSAAAVSTFAISEYRCS